MKTTLTLPGHYRETFLIDLKANKKQNLIVNGLALLLLVFAFAAAYLIQPFSLDEVDFSGAIPQVITAVIGTVAYIILHETVHGVLFWHFSGIKPTFGASLEFAYAASSAYYCRRDYLIIGLAPVVLWGIVLAVVGFIVPADWYWAVQFIQLMNISGAGGDVYVTWKLSRMPADILILDEGIRMTVYSPDRQ